MIKDCPELVALKRALGQQLAALRDASEIGQQQVAHKTGYSRSSVAHAEAGRQLLTRDFWITADELLQAEGALLTSYEQVQAAKQEHEARCREVELAKAYAEAKARAEELRATAPPYEVQNGNGALPTGQQLLPGLVAAVGAELADSLAGPLLFLALLSTPSSQVRPVAWRGQLKEQLQTFLHEWANTVERREHLRLLGWVATTIAASPFLSNLNTDEQERLSQVVAMPSRVDNQAIDHIETILSDCKRQQDTFGSKAVLHTVIAQREFVGSLLDECSDELRPRLLSLYSSMSISIGYYLFDLDDVASAMHYCDQARAAAQEARNTELAIYALCNMSYGASLQGKAHAGLDFAAAAQSMAHKTDDALWHVFAAERAGIAYAIDGQYKACMTEFDRARAGLAASSGRMPPDSPLYWYHEGVIDSQKSYCLLQLGQPVQAAASASRGLKLFDNSFGGDLAVCTLRLATARLQSGEVAEAAQVLGGGALLAARRRSARLTNEVRAARGRLQPWKDTAVVRELDEKLVGWGLG